MDLMEKTAEVLNYSSFKMTSQNNGQESMESGASKGVFGGGDFISITSSFFSRIMDVKRISGST